MVFTSDNDNLSEVKFLQYILWVYMAHLLRFGAIILVARLLSVGLSSINFIAEIMFCCLRVFCTSLISLVALKRFVPQLFRKRLAEAPETFNPALSSALFMISRIPFLESLPAKLFLELEIIKGASLPISSSMIGPGILLI